MRLFILSFLLLSYLVFESLCSCTGRKDAICSVNTKAEAIQLAYRRKIVVEYQINDSFVNVSHLMIFRHWGSDEAMMYVMDNDTLTFSWNRNHGDFSDSMGTTYFYYHLIRDSLLIDKPSLTSGNFGELRGVVCHAKYKDKHKIEFIGINDSTGVELLATYSVNPKSPTYRDDFFCILRSMTFK
jgi:hypothetical protein